MKGFKITGKASSLKRQHPQLQTDVVPLRDGKHERNYEEENKRLYHHVSAVDPDSLNLDPKPGFLVNPDTDTDPRF
jgi:hypothetical protein